MKHFIRAGIGFCMGFLVTGAFLYGKPEDKIVGALLIGFYLIDRFTTTNTYDEN